MMSDLESPPNWQQAAARIGSSAQLWKRRLRRFRAGLSFLIVAMAQFLSPAAAADPASRIDPPAWSHRHSRQEIQAYGARIARAEAPETQRTLTMHEARLRRILRQDRG